MRKLLLLAACLCSLPQYAQTIALTQYATGLSSAVAIEHPANDARLFVVQQGGLIRIVNTNGSINATPFLDLTTLTVGGGERGLLGLAFHPNYATNGLFYVNYTNLSGNTVIAQYSVSANPNVANTTGTILMTISQPASNHNGGTLRFGSDGYLYIGMGDGGGAGDTSGYAQNLDLNHTQVVSNPSRIYLGKMLRIDVNTTSGSLNYGIPATNPYVGQAGKEEIWAIGVRNPWKFSFNRTTGDMWIADVGQGSIEEINRIAVPLSNSGLNFGWRCYEGNAVYSTSIAPCPSYASTVAPFAQYTHVSGRCSITGGYFYTGTTYPNFQNKYFFADYCTGEIGYISPTGTLTWGYDFTGSITSFGEDRNGELYVTNGGTIYNVVDTLEAAEFEKSGFSLYPNPASDVVYVKSTEGVAAQRIELFDTTGKLVSSQLPPAGTEYNIPVSNLAKGMYVVSILTSEGSHFATRVMVK